ncbi:hypothetical protein COHA_004563 [Chlorella ohadii]|uniref:BRO1 domain-containing protein n=1 Tax=Chlorella ohadii TaxID=2649997 RepID=A0AAD5DSX5_9CHLO|nr:hypothetical protein COHA_004563 [Chlorella ohadii]
MTLTIMLAVHCKKSEPADLKPALVEYAASDAADDLEEVMRLRANILNQTGSLQVQADNLAKYYRLLTLMESRFPVSHSAGHARVEFAWFDAFRPQKRAEQASLHFEKAAIAFNLGAVQSQLALACDRKTDAGLKESAKLFQVEQPRPLDLTPESASMLEKLMLAQAQECVLEKAIADKKASGVVARLAKQCAVFYRECATLLAASPLNQHFDRSWLAHATVKALMYEVEATIQNSAALRDADEFAGVAKEIARLRASQVTLAQARAEAKNASKDLQDNVAYKEEQVAKRLAQAERENATVYLQARRWTAGAIRVLCPLDRIPNKVDLPAITSLLICSHHALIITPNAATPPPQRIPNEVDLPAIVPAPLVKPTPPAGLKPTADEQQTMFTSVVPDSSAKALSKYSDMVDTLIRDQVHKLNGASDDARLRLREWELPEALQALEAASVSALPDAVRVELEEIQSGGGLGHLQEVSQQIRELRGACLEELDQVEGDLDAEQKEDDDLRAHYGPRWKRPPSSQLTKSMRDKLNGYRGNLMQAGDSDKRLQEKLAAEAAAFAALDPEAAATQMPKMQAPMLSVDNMEPAAAVATLRRALDGLNTLGTQRAALEEALKDRKNKDNILPKLLGGGDTPDEVFKTELKKYDDLVMEVDNNVSKSAQLLDVVSANVGIFKNNYGYQEWRRACEGAASGVRASARTYKDLRDNLGEGLRFYMGLQDAIRTLRQQVGDHVMTRRIQRDDLIEDLRKQAAEEADRAAAQLAAMNMQQAQQAHQAHQAPPPPPIGSAPSYGSGSYPPPAVGAPGAPYDGSQGGSAPVLTHSGSGQYMPPPQGGTPPPPPPGPGYGAPPPQQQPQGGYYQPAPQQQYSQQYPQYQTYSAPPPPQQPYGAPMQQQNSGSWAPPPQYGQQQQQYAPPPQYQQQQGYAQPNYAQQPPPPPPGQQQQQPGQGPPTQPQQHGNPIGQFFGSVFGR